MFHIKILTLEMKSYKSKMKKPDYWRVHLWFLEVWMVTWTTRINLLLEIREMEFMNISFSHIADIIMKARDGLNTNWAFATLSPKSAVWKKLSRHFSESLRPRLSVAKLVPVE